MNLKNQQLIKIILLTICAIAGLYLYIVNNGSLLKAIVIFCFFAFLGKLSMVSYHRWMAHRYFEPGPILKFLLLYSVVVSALVRPLHYVIGHRLHHRYSDTDNDPHPPKIGFFNALVGNFNEPKNVNVSIKDMYRHKEIMFVHNHYYKLYFLHLLILLLIDVDLFLLSFAFSSLKNVVYTTIFNYIAHGGKQQSGPQNLPWYYNFLVLGFFGEQLHKNHHDDPSNPNFGRLSFLNFDLGYYFLTKVAKVRIIS